MSLAWAPGSVSRIGCSFISRGELRGGCSCREVAVAPAVSQPCGAFDERGEQPRFGRGFGDQQPFPPGTADEFPGDRKQPVAPPLHVPDPGGMARRKDGELHP